MYSNHPLFAVQKETLQISRNADIKGNKYNTKHCEQIQQVLEELCNRSGVLDNLITEVT